MLMTKSVRPQHAGSTSLHKTPPPLARKSRVMTGLHESMRPQSTQMPALDAFVALQHCFMGFFGPVAVKSELFLYKP
jgi:hypothetical protein